MYKLLIILVAAVLLSLGLAYPEFILQRENIDTTTISKISDDAIPISTETDKSSANYDVPKPEGEPLPPPPPGGEDDEYPLPPLKP
jgi:hypothetical protein